MTTGELFLAVEDWARERNLLEPEYKSRQALKVMEEVGETMAALARGDKEKLADGIGDSIVTLIIDTYADDPSDSRADVLND